MPQPARGSQPVGPWRSAQVQRTGKEQRGSFSAPSPPSAWLHHQRGLLGASYWFSSSEAVCRGQTATKECEPAFFHLNFLLGLCQMQGS